MLHQYITPETIRANLIFLLLGQLNSTGHQSLRSDTVGSAVRKADKLHTEEYMASADQARILPPKSELIYSSNVLLHVEMKCEGSGTPTHHL